MIKFRFTGKQVLKKNADSHRGLNLTGLKCMTISDLAIRTLKIYKRRAGRSKSVLAKLHLKEKRKKFR